MKIQFRALIIGLLILLTVINLEAQSKEQIFKEFKSNYPMYWSGTKFLLKKQRLTLL